MNTKNELFLRYAKGRDVLDLGVEIEEGNFYEDDTTHSVLSKEAKSIIGLEIDPMRQNEAIKRGFNVLLGDAQDYKLNRKFDTIVAGNIIEHLTNFDGFIKCAHKHLRDKGYFVLSTNNAYGSSMIIRNLLGKNYQFNEHTCIFDEITLKQLFQRYGGLFEIEYFCHYTPQFNDPKMLFIRMAGAINKKWSQDMFIALRKV